MKEFKLKKYIMMPLVLLLVQPAIILASETAEAEPSIWDGDIATSIFAVLLFGMMIFVLGKYAWGPILSGLKEREDYIQQQIKDAERMKNDADKSLRRYEARLEKAQARADDIIAEAREEAEKVSAKMAVQAQEKAAEIVNQATSSIANAKEQAVRDLHGYSTELAVELAGKILGRSISAEDHRELIAKTINEIEAN